MLKALTRVISQKIWRKPLTLQFIRKMNNLWEGGLWDALSIKFSWAKILPGNKPHSNEGTAALKKLITEETAIKADSLKVTTLPKGTEVVGFSPSRAVADHIMVFNKKPKTTNFNQKVLPKIIVKDSKPSTFEISSAVDSCLTQKLEDGNAYLINMHFLKPKKVSSIAKEEVSSHFYNKKPL